MDLQNWRTWLRPGMRIKRWVILFMIGVTTIAIGIAMAVTWAYRNYYGSLQESAPIVEILTLQFIPHPYRELLLIAAGVAVMAYAILQLSQAVLGPLMALTASDLGLADIVAEHRFGANQPEMNVVAIGGGTGLSTLLRGLKHENVNITAVVTVTDDGGSSGKLKESWAMPAPGDIRNCITALSDNESLLSQLFQYRFSRGDSGLQGHSMGNLLIAALTDITGSFENAVAESSRVLNIHGRVLPSTLEKVELGAEFEHGGQIIGETQLVAHGAPIDRVFLVSDPDSTSDTIEPNLAAIEAIVGADLVILGPGSLYTSVVPNLLVPGVAEAVRWTKGNVVYACNVATQAGETDWFSAEDHIRVVSEYLPGGSIDFAVINSNPAIADAIAADVPVTPVLASPSPSYQGVTIVPADVISPQNPLRHDPAKLSSELLKLGVATAPVQQLASEASLVESPVPVAVPGD